MFKSVRERKGVVVAHITKLLVLLKRILAVPNVTAPSLPPLVLQFTFLLRVENHLHTLIVKGLRLDHVEHIELDLLALPHVLHTEVIPLSVALGIYIVL